LYYFQMTGSGLPPSAGTAPRCTFIDGFNQGNAAGQYDITEEYCYSIGLVANQAWEIDTSKNPQVISITFSGGQERRQTVVSVTCDPSADEPTFVAKGEMTRTLLYVIDITSKYACSQRPPPPAPAPPNPPAPNPGYRCINNACTALPADSAAFGYGTLSDCAMGCGPPFWCVSLCPCGW
jgi:hypothetical protein